LTPLFERICLEDVDRSDELFSMSFEPDLSRLRESVKRVGILEPLWLREKGGRFQIVGGFRRFDTALSLREERVPALIWKGEQLEDMRAFWMSLHSNVTARGLNPVEKGLVLGKLLDHFRLSRKEVIRTAMPLLGLEPSEKILSGFLLLNGFPTPLKRYLLSHGASLATVSLLGRFTGEEQESLAGFLAPLRLGENVLREILTFMWEISRRDGVRVDEVISGEEMRRLLSDGRLSGPQRIEAIRRVLREKRYPRLSALEETFRSARKRMRLSPKILLKPPPFFEGNRFRIEIGFETLEEYRAALSELRDLPEESINSLLAIKGYGGDTHGTGLP